MLPLNRLRADALLLMTAMIWGTGFVAQKYGNAVMGPVTFVGARFLLSALMVLPLALYERRKQSAALTRRDYWTAALVGLCLFAGSSLQQIGLVTTTATNGGFLTALYVVLVPFTTWLVTRQPLRPIVVAASLISIFGAWLLASNSQLQAWTLGDGLVIISDIAWAFGITLVSVFMLGRDRPFFLCFAQYAITAVLGLAAGLTFEPYTAQGLQAAIPAILYAGLVSGALGFTLQAIAQRHTPAPEAALIMSLESVFAAVAGAILLQEFLTPLGLAGCVLILLGVVLVETGPAILRRIGIDR